MHLNRIRLVELGLVICFLIVCLRIQIVEAQSEIDFTASAWGKYRDLIQVVNCLQDKNRGNYSDYGYWGGTSYCGQTTRPGYWVWVNPNWYIWSQPASELEQSREIARRLREDYRGWQDKLDDCPCTRAEAENHPRFRDATQDYLGFYKGQKMPKYHPGAEFDFRTRERFVVPFTPLSGGVAIMPGQQCTYDSKGDLITGGAGAGTPDAYSPEVTLPGQGVVSNNSHTFWDVNPFDRGIKVQEYQQTWVPNNKNSCPTNIVNEPGKICRTLAKGDYWYPNWRYCCDEGENKSRWMNEYGQVSVWGGSCASWGVRGITPSKDEI